MGKLGFILKLECLMDAITNSATVEPAYLQHQRKPVTFTLVNKK
jgi:hypothetical protein